MNKLNDAKLEVLDCTIRDGGLTNKSDFPIDTVRAVYRAACEAGIDYIELGYRNSKKIFSTEEYGPWRFCEENTLRKTVNSIEKRNTKISIMQDAHKAEAEDIIPKSESVVDLIRIATYVKDIDKAVRLANNASEKGYMCSINIMAISRETTKDIEYTLKKIESETSVEMVYIVDSFGALYPEDVNRLFDMYKKHLTNKKIGVHFHNNQQLAFANSIEVIRLGIDCIDGTLYGLGRGAGNCPIELLIGYLRSERYDLLPLLEVIEEKILKLRENIDWGYHIPYMLSGILNKHPKDACDWLSSSNKYKIIEFYKNIMGN